MKEVRYQKMPPEIFAVIQTLVISSLIYAPVPFAASRGSQYTNQTLLISLATGVGIAMLALATFLNGAMKIKTYLKLSCLVGLACLTFSVLTLKTGSIPGNLFLCYGGLLIFSALALRPSAVERVILDKSPLNEIGFTSLQKSIVFKGNETNVIAPRAA